MVRPNIVLTGFMGCGKTTVGRLLAEELQYRFVDTDRLIEQRTGLTVAQLFHTRGEGAFRDLEADIAEELGREEGMVVATGGRMMLDPASASALGDNGLIFCLVASPEEILRRVSNDTGSKRPLLDTPQPIARIIELMEKRQSGYDRFVQIVTTGRSPEEIVQEILGRCQSVSRNFWCEQ